MSNLAGEDDDLPSRPRTDHRAQQHSATKRFFGLTALGTVLPGVGLSFTKRRTLGLVVFGLFLACLIALLALIGTQGFKDSLINLAVTPARLVALTVIILVGAVIWVGSIVLTAEQTEPRPLAASSSWLLRGFTVLMCLLVVVPSAQAVRVLSAHRGLIDTVFQGKHPGSSQNYAHPNLSNSKDPWEGTPRVNLLLLGSDAGPDRTGIRPDSMMIASIDTKTGDTVLVGIPRNLQDVPFPAKNPLHKLYPHGYNCGSQCLMNAVWHLAEEHKKLFPGDDNPGLTSTQQVLSKLTGLKIDYTTIVDLKGFSSLVNAMGGVNINVQERLPIGGKVERGVIVPGSITGWLKPGKQHLNGRQALWYSRSRATTDDFSRMRRQRCMVGAIVDQVNPVTMLEKYTTLAGVLQANLQTDISQKELGPFVSLVERMQKGNITSLAFGPDNISTVHPDVAKMRKLVKKAIHPPPAPTHTAKATPSGKKSATPGSTPTTSSSHGGVVSLQSAC